MRNVAEVRCCSGRYVLFVNDLALVMQGDKCRCGDLPEEVYDPIPEEELKSAHIGGTPIKDLPIKTVRFFRGDFYGLIWNVKMLRYVADEINKSIQPSMLEKIENAVD